MAWTPRANIRGATGPAGPAGATGPAGTDGNDTPHADRHAVDGDDPVTPDSIGAPTAGRALALSLILGG